MVPCVVFHKSSELLAPQLQNKQHEFRIKKRTLVTKRMWVGSTASQTQVFIPPTACWSWQIGAWRRRGVKYPIAQPELDDVAWVLEPMVCLKGV